MHLGDSVRPKPEPRMVRWVDEGLSRRSQGRLLDVDAEVAAEWGRLQARAESLGKPVPVVDALIAATAIVHYLTFVTRNVKDLRRRGP